MNIYTHDFNGGLGSTPTPERGSVTRSLSRRAAFSLIEILVTVALLSVIILGLVAMFNQTRRAFTSSLTQVDVLEAGRAAAGMIASEVEQMAPLGFANVPNFYVDTPLTYQQIIQPLVDTNDVHTNTIQELYFLTTSYNQSHTLSWNIVGYKIFTPAKGIGTLYRFSSNNITAANLPAYLTNNGPISVFTNALTYTNTTPGASFSRIIDGVIDFRIRAYDTNGNLFGYAVTNRTVYANNYADPFLGDYHYVFTSNSVPAYVEIELGIVEDRTLARYAALTNSSVPAPAALVYLANHPGQVHIFRQRIPIRNVNPAAYQ